MDSWAEMEEQILKELNLHRMKDDAEVFSRLERYSGSEAGKQPWIIWFRSWKQRGLNMNGIIMSL